MILHQIFCIIRSWLPCLIACKSIWLSHFVDTRDSLLTQRSHISTGWTQLLSSSYSNLFLFTVASSWRSEISEGNLGAWKSHIVPEGYDAIYSNKSHGRSFLPLSFAFSFSILISISCWLIAFFHKSRNSSFVLRLAGISGSSAIPTPTTFSISLKL